MEMTQRHDHMLKIHLLYRLKEMKMKGLYRKRLGKWGEEKLDSWLLEEKWKAIQKNKKIKQGEIDRIYQYNPNTYCIAEVKTIYLSNNISEQYLFSEIFLKKFLKNRQLTNLVKFGENLFSYGAKKIYIRIFLILVFKKNKNPIKKQEISNSIKICYVHNNVAIISLNPEFTSVNSGKSLLEIQTTR